jgi:hypothetical protein
MTGPGQQPPTADGDLWALLESHVDGAATPAERNRLETRLRAEQQARLFYVTYLDLHAQLQWRTRGESVPATMTRPPSRRILGLRPRSAAVLLALAASLLAVVLIRLPRSDEVEPPDLPDVPAGSVAVLIDNSNTIWEADTALPTETGSALPPGRLKLKAGVVAIAFLGGGEVLLEGPADFEVRAPDHGCLHQGKLTAKVAAGAPAFRLNMPGVVVTDHGGECGLLRDESGHTEVHVFKEGQVDAGLTDPTGEPVPAMRLTENAGTQVDTGRQTLTPLPLNESAFAHLRPEVRVADASVRAGQFAGRNFGAACRLRVKNSIPDYSWETYLCFDLSGITGPMREARVRLVPAQVGQPFENAAAVVADHRWNETTLTWASKPSSGPAFATWMVAEGVPVEFDVTRFVREALAGDKKLSLRIFAPNFERRKSFVEYGSRKGEAQRRPQLLVTTLP